MSHESIPLSKELSDAIYEAAGRVVKLLREDLKGVDADMGAIKGEITEINESLTKIKENLVEIEAHIKSIGERKP